MFAAVREAKKHLPIKEVSSLIPCTHVVGKKEDNGYKYLHDVGISVQGQDANNAWKTTYNILKAIKVPVEVALVWRDNPKTLAWGTTHKLIVAFD